MNWIVDVALVAVILVITIIGIAKGGVNCLLGFASGIVILVACFFLTAPVGNAVCKGELDEKFATAISEKMNLDNGQSKLYYANTDNDATTPDVLVFANGEGEISTLSAYLQAKPAFSKLTGYIEGIAKDTLAEKGEVTIGFVFALIIAQLVIKVIAFIVLFLAFKLVFAIIKKLWKKAREKGTVIKKADRIFGAILGIVFAYCLISLFFAVFGLLFDFGILGSFAAKLNASPVARFFMNYNLFDLMITKLWMK